MLSRPVLGLCILCFGSVALAQPAAPEGGQAPPPQAEEPTAPRELDKTITIRGRVIDSLGRPVRGAQVSVEGASNPSTTAKDGWFRTQAAIGATLVIESNGYEVGLVTVDAATLDDIVLLTIEQTSETIEISGEGPPASPGAAKLDRHELQRVPGAGGDVVRALTVMPGVVNLQVPLGFSGVVIRGSSPQDSKVLLDDFEIPVLFHNLGARAVVPAEAIQSLDFIPGGFDVAFGRASSGIVSLVTRPGGDERTTQAEVSVLDGGLLAQGRIGKKGRYMFGLRRSMIDFVLPSLIPDSADLSFTTVPSYYDEQLRLDYEPSSKWKLALSSLGSLDTLELYETKDTDAETKRFFNRTQFLRLTASARYHDGPWNVNLALSGIATEWNIELGAFQRIKATLPTIGPRAEVTHTWDKALGLSNVEWRTGGEIQASHVTLDLATPPEPREGESDMSVGPRDNSLVYKGKFWVSDFAAWTAVAADLDPRIRVTLGVRGDAFARNDEVTPQPRGEIKVKLAPRWTARLSAGEYVRPPEYQTEYLYTNIKSEHSTQMIAGLQWDPTDGARVQASGYYTDRTNLITREMDEELGNDGRGTTVGGELLATYRGGPWFTWLSYSYTHSTRVDRPGEPRRLFSYDQPHSLNAAASWKHKRWQLGGRFQLYSGLPYTPAIGSIFDSDRNAYIPVYGEPNSERAPIHHQLDLRADYTWKWGPTAFTFFVDVQNVYMNQSVVTYFYGYDFTERTAFKSLPILPSLGLRGVL